MHMPISIATNTLKSSGLLHFLNTLPDSYPTLSSYKLYYYYIAMLYLERNDIHKTFKVNNEKKLIYFIQGNSHFNHIKA